MTIEQKAELNQLLDSNKPLTWADRWRTFKLTLPIWVFIFVCMAEMAFLRAWLTNKLSLEFIAARIVLFPVLLFVIAWGLVEFQTWLFHRQKRTLVIKDKCIAMHPKKHPSLAWRFITRFQFEPAVENSSLTKLSIYGRASGSKQVYEVRRFTLVIENPDQVQELIRELETKRHLTGADFKIVTPHKPEPPPAENHFPLAKYLAATLTGFYLFLHGFPLLMISLLPRRQSSESTSDFAPEQIAKIANFLVSHFSTFEQLRHFYLITGIVLVVAGLALMFWRMRMDADK